jgi:hypothetical protein
MKIQEYTAIEECENLYKSKIDNFSKITGITADNVDFLESPKLKKSKKIISMKWDKTIELGSDEQDSFACQYNFATNKAYDRSE